MLLTDEQRIKIYIHMKLEWLTVIIKKCVRHTYETTHKMISKAK